MNNTTLKEILDKTGWSESDIKKVYSGKSHTCRCGCQGDYFGRGSPEFDEIMAEIKEGVMLDHGFSDDDIGPGYVNLDLAGTDDMCYCLYTD